MQNVRRQQLSPEARWLRRVDDDERTVDYPVERIRVTRNRGNQPLLNMSTTKKENPLDRTGNPATAGMGQS